MAHDLARVMAVLFGAALMSACGGQSGSDDDRDAVDPCSPAPVVGTPCDDYEVQCVYPEGRCITTLYCAMDAWMALEDCPMPDGCPASFPQVDEACTLGTAEAGFECNYDTGCGRVDAVCNGSEWSVEAFPVDECDQLCDVACDRLGVCGIGWSATCLDRCKLAYLCPGETSGHDAAICSGLSGELAALGCTDLCAQIAEQTGLSETEVGCSGLTN